MNEMLRDGEAIFAWVLQSSWQAGVLVLVVVMAQTIFRRRLSPAWRYGLWLLVLVRLLLPKSPHTAWSIYNVARLPAALEQENATPNLELADHPLKPGAGADVRSALPGSSADITHAPALPSPTGNGAASGRTGLSMSWRRVGLFIWILGASAFALRLVSSNLRFSGQVRRDSTALDDERMLLLESCQEAMGVCAQIGVLQTSAVRAPSIHGLWRKRLLLPKGTLELLSREELRCVFLHELAHIKRRDLEVSWLVSVMLVVHWFNPLLWLVASRMRNDCELACDAFVLTRAGSGIAQPYGETILKVVEHLLPRSAPPGVLALSEERRRLKERIWMIARFKRWPRWSALAWTLSLGIAAVGLTNAGRVRVAEARAQDRPSPAISQEQATTGLPRGIHGQVVDSQGNPVANADVKCQGKDWRTTTDAQGHFSWNGEDKPRTFQISKSSYKTLFTELLKPGETETVLRMQHTPVIAGKVINKETQQPIAVFQVYAVRTLHGPVTPALAPHDMVQGSGGAFKYSFAYFYLPDTAFYIDAEGYLPVLSRPLTGDDDGKELVFELTPSRPVEGKVLTPQGTAAEKAQLRLWCGEPNMSNIPRRHETESDKNGAFTVPAVLDGKVIAYHTSGYAEVSWSDFAANGTVQLSEWGQVKGHWANPPPNNRKVSLERINWSGHMNTYTVPPPWRPDNTSIHSDGAFDFEDRIPAGEYMLTEWHDLRINYLGGGFSVALLVSRRAPVRVEAGRTTFVELPTGPSVVGRIDVGDEQSFTNVHLPIVSLRLKQHEPEFKFPPLDPSLSDAQNFERWKQYRERVLEYWLSDQGMAQRRAERTYELPAESDGTFRIDNVPPGTYELQINSQRWAGKAGPEIRREIAISQSGNEALVDLGLLK